MVEISEVSREKFTRLVADLPWPRCDVIGAQEESKLLWLARSATDVIMGLFPNGSRLFEGCFSACVRWVGTALAGDRGGTFLRCGGYGLEIRSSR